MEMGLLLIAGIVIGIQSIAIVLLVSLVNKLREDKKQDKKEARTFIKSLIALVVELEADKNDYKVAYHECYGEYKTLFKQNRTLEKQLNKVTDMHGKVVNNLILHLKQGKIIKSKYMEHIIPYKFETMTLEEVTQFFGNKIS